jgi:hypothetical protein
MSGTALAVAGGAKVGGIYFNNKAKGKINAARNRASTAELERQRGYWDDIDERLDETLNSVVANREGNSGRISAQRDSDLASLFNGSDGTMSTKQFAGADMKTLADLFNQNQTKLQESAWDTNRIGNAALQSASILPLELQAANSAGDKYSTLAGLFNGAGDMAASYYMYGGGK